MQGLNDGFYFVIDKIIDLQAFFLKQAFSLSRVVFLIALLTAALNYALTGTGLKENMVKIGKALAFFLIVYFAYPSIVGAITTWTFSMAEGSLFESVEQYYNEKTYVIAEEAETAKNLAPPARERKRNPYMPGSANVEKTFSKDLFSSINEDPNQFFGGILITRSHAKINYTTVAPAAVLKAVLLVAGGCLMYADSAPKFAGILPDFGIVLKGLICALFVIFTGVFAVLEYLIAFLEFMLVASVGVILLPLSIWEGSKFMTEKFYGAMIGFFIKLLFCNIAIFLMLFGFISLAHQFTVKPFTGLVDEILSVIFSCLLFFYICKSAPGLAQSLLTGTPSLSATGAISAVAGGVAAAGGAMGLAKGAVGGIAGTTAKTAFAASGALSEASGAAGAAGMLGASKAGAFMSSLAHSAVQGAGESFNRSGSNLVRSLLGDKGGGNTGGGSGAGNNRHLNERQKFLAAKNDDGTGPKTFAQQKYDRQDAGIKAGFNYAKDQALKELNKEQNA